MKAWKLIVFGVLFVGLTLVALDKQRPVLAQKGGDDDPYYEVDPNWPQPLSNNLDWSRTPAIYAESPNRVYVFQTGQLPSSYRAAPVNDSAHPNWPYRAFPGLTNCKPSKCIPGESPIIDGSTKKPLPGARWEHLMNVFDANGKLVESWDQTFNDQIINPHGIQIDPNDPERHVWVADNGGDRVLKFTHDGKKLVMALGEFGVTASDHTHLGGPSGIAFYPNGDFLITDGYKNSRVVKFSKDGKFMMEWGKKGTGPGEFDTPHSVEILRDGRIIVGDRGNKRIQVFDPYGKYLTEIMAVYSNDLAVSVDERFLYVDQGGPDAETEIRTYSISAAGAPRLVSSWGRPFGGKPGTIWGAHGFSRDSDGNMYFGESWGGRGWKYRVKKGVNPARLPFEPFKRNTFK
jgi:peptidylamidoglycolate lyase